MDGSPSPTPKYPELHKFSKTAEEAEEKQREAREAGQTASNIPAAFVEIVMEDEAAANRILAWLRENDISGPVGPDPSGMLNETVAIYLHLGASVFVMLPGNLLLPATEQDGFLWINDGCYNFPTQCPPYQNQWDIEPGTSDESP